MSDKISELGLINYFKKILQPKRRDVFKGIGDDAAVIRINKDKCLLLTSDMLIEGRHFLAKDSLYDVGYKAMACSISDIAAMGGVPAFALVSLGLPKNFKNSQVQLLYKGFKKAIEKFCFDIVGGDVNACDKLVIDISMAGFVERKKLVLRSGAKIGDYIFVTGRLGGSIYSRHLNFVPRVREAKILTDNFKLNSMIDISDGLIIDLYRILEQSKVGAVIFENLIPQHKDAKNLEEALYMGEDFELLFTVDEKQGDLLLGEIAQKKIKFPLSMIGRIIDEKYKIFMLDKHRKLKKLNPKGFLHF